jgi:CrcB protein
MTAFAVALGGGVGALARYAVEGVIAQRQSSPFPLSTLVVNVLGSTALGALTGALGAGRIDDTVLAWAGTGFLGGFTTFSTFTYETVRLIEDGAWRYAAWNLALSGSLSFVGAGITFLALRNYL